jgi:hypothetical protein
VTPYKLKCMSVPDGARTKLRTHADEVQQDRGSLRGTVHGVIVEVAEVEAADHEHPPRDWLLGVNVPHSNKNGLRRDASEILCVPRVRNATGNVSI